MSKFNIGDKVRRIADYGHGHVPRGGLATVTGIVSSASGSIYLDDDTEYTHSVDSYELVESVPLQKFTKSDLQSGMKVVFRSGGERIYHDGIFYEKINKSLDWTSTSDNFNNDLTFKSGKHADIVEVYERDGTLLWKREEKSQQEIEYEKLKEQVDVMTKQMIALGKTIGK